jgi:hypothetical protein
MPQTTVNHNFYINSNSISLTQGEELIFKFKISGSSSANFTASLSSEGSLSIRSNTIATGYAYATVTSCTPGTPGFIATGSSNNEIVFNRSLSTFYNTGYQFIPSPDLQNIATNASSSLYIDYGDVNYAFSVSTYDIVIFILADNSFIESRVSSVYNDGTQIHLFLTQDLNNTTRTAINNQTFQRFLLLKRVEDETNAILTFPKRPGQTSYGFLIPENLAKDVLANIDTITSQVKTKLLNEQGSVITDINGGGF